VSTIRPPALDAPPPTPPRLVIVGATATGKSAVALEVARRLPGELVCVDAMTVYRGMDIGTAKPSAAERAEIPHHLLDLFEPTEESSLARFVDAGRAVLAALDGAGTNAVVVGGTGLYVDALVDGLDLPGQWPGVRAALHAELDAGAPPEALHARLAALDPLAATRMEPSNARRIVRALEVTIGSGRPFSSFGPGLQSARAAHTERFVMIGIARSRASIAERIRRRYAQQLEAGFVEEARALLERHGSRLSRTARQALGYRELWDAFAAGTPIADALETAAVRTIAFAKRQERWFRRDARIVWLDADARTTGELAAECLMRLGHLSA
jgi:tRNA dimethylallyltransferase